MMYPFGWLVFDYFKDDVDKWEEQTKTQTCPGCHHSMRQHYSLQQTHTTGAEIYVYPDLCKEVVLSDGAGFCNCPYDYDIILDP